MTDVRTNLKGNCVGALEHISKKNQQGHNVSIRDLKELTICDKVLLLPWKY